jgi:hypothetical protein
MPNLFGRRSSLAGAIPEACIGCSSMLGLMSVRLCESKYAWRDVFCEECLRDFREAFAGAIAAGNLLIETETVQWNRRFEVN